MRSASPARWPTHVVFLDGGRIVESGPPAEVIDAPSATRTRDFLAAVL